MQQHRLPSNYHANIDTGEGEGYVGAGEGLRSFVIFVVPT